MIPVIQYVDRVDSTNEEAKRRAKKPNAEGTIIVALEQSAGKGSQGRKWTSPQGGVYLSTLLRAKSPHPATTLSILAGAAAAQAVRDSLPKAFEVCVKWPNDVLINRAKVAGVLCEAIEDGKNPLCVLGVGINVNLSEDQLKDFRKNAFSATSFQIATGGKKHNIERVAETLARKIMALHQLYWAEGFEPISEIWESNCPTIGKPLTFRHANQEQKAMFLGIDRTGALVLSNEKGERKAHHVGEITCFLQ